MDLVIATNNGEMGGGEVMLLNIARVLRSLGHRVTVIGPSHPEELLDAALDEGFPIISLPAHNRVAYMTQLRIWRSQNRDTLLWCNGLLPSFATAGYKNRIVHLHQIPEGKLKALAMLAKRKSLVTLVPSQFAVSKISGSEEFYNWVAPVEKTKQIMAPSKTIRVGFLGRPSLLKGTHHLARAVKKLNEQKVGLRYQLVIGGESKFISETDKIELLPVLQALGEDLIELGWVSQGEYFSAVDITVVPSNCSEVFGLVAAEAMSAEVPLIVSDAGALPEVVGEGYPFIFSQSNVEELAELITSITEEIQSSSPLLENTVRQSYWRWKEYFSPEAGKSRVELLIQTIMKKEWARKDNV